MREFDDAVLASVFQRRSDWLETRGLRHAADYLGVALQTGRVADAKDAAEEVVSDITAPVLARRVANRVLSSSERRVHTPDIDSAEGIQVAAQRGVAAARHALHDSPRNAFRWVELARHYTILHEIDKARTAMANALRLAPQNRHVLRSAARLRAHRDKFDDAHHLLVTSRVTRGDPWLVASEIALAGAAQESPRNLRQAREMLDSGRFTDFALSELAAALGTARLEAGDDREARRLFRRALVDPSENALAQVVWAAQSASLALPDDTVSVGSSFEASARVAADNHDPDEIITNTWRWLLDQPFSAQPAAFGSYHASLNQRYEQGAEFAAAGLRANPDDFLLLNNYVFCLACSGDVGAANARFATVVGTRLNRRDRTLFDATSGLLAFRTGQLDAGRALYERAIRDAPEARLRAHAAVMLAREEAVARTPQSTAAFDRALALSRKVGVNDLMLWLDQAQFVLDQALRQGLRMPEAHDGTKGSRRTSG